MGLLIDMLIWGWFLFWFVVSIKYLSPMFGKGGEIAIVVIWGIAIFVYFIL